MTNMGLDEMIGMISILSHLTFEWVTQSIEPDLLF